MKPIQSKLARLTLLAIVAIMPSPTLADWPQFLGPTRDGVYKGKAIVDELPADGPRIVFKRKVGEGYAGPVVADGKLILFHRVGGEDVVECFDVKALEADGDAKPLWQVKYATRYFDPLGKGNGPRATPAIGDGRVVTFGPSGVLQCIDLNKGELIWRVDTAKEYQSDKGFFGRACSPLIEGDLVLLNIGGTQSGAGIGAFKLSNGELAWKTTDHEAGYASPAAATIRGKRHGLFFTRTGLVAVDPKTGDIRFEQRWRSQQHASVNAATPLAIGNLIFVSSSYQTGALLLAVGDDGEPEKVWSNDESLSAQYVTPVHRDGMLYGFHGRHDFNETSLRCIELKTGKVRWSQPMPGGPIILADDKLVIVTEDGKLLLAEATPAGYAKLGAATILRDGVRAHPALVEGKLYARDDRELICVELGESGGN